MFDAKNFNAFSYLYKLVLKMKSVSKGQKQSSVRGERNHRFPFLMKKFKPIKIAFIFSIFIYFLPQKNSLFTSDIHYLWNGIDFESLILLKYIHFYKKFVAIKIRKCNVMFHTTVLVYPVTSLQFSLRTTYYDNRKIYLLLRYLQSLLCYYCFAKCYLKGIACNLF